LSACVPRPSVSLAFDPSALDAEDPGELVEAFFERV
jgi:hypothetical protein